MNNKLNPLSVEYEETDESNQYGSGVVVVVATAVSFSNIYDALQANILSINNVCEWIIFIGLTYKKNAIATAIGIHTNIYVTGPERGQKEHKLICSYIYVVVLVQSI